MPRVAIPSELLEPVLAEVFDWYLREAVTSGGSDESTNALLAAAKVINRLTIVNRGEDGRSPAGVHASMAAMNELRLAESFAAMAPDERRIFVGELR